MVDAERGMALFAKHASGAAVGGLVETLVAVWIEGIWVHGNLKRRRDLPRLRTAGRHRDTETEEERIFWGMLLVRFRLDAESYKGNGTAANTVLSS